MELVFAYIDPGSGSLVVQALIAGVVALPIFFRRQITRFVDSLRGQSDANGSSASSNDSRKGG